MLSEVLHVLREGFTFPAPGSGFRADKSRRPLEQPLGRVKLALLIAILVVNTAGCVWLASSLQGPRRARVLACAVCGAVFCARVLVQLCVFWHRRIVPYEVIAECFLLIPISLGSIAYGAAVSTVEPGVVDVVGALIFLLGTHLNMWPELQRHRFKQRPGNANALYTDGLQRFCRHINYTGEVLSFAGFAVVTGQWWNLWVPLAMGVGMARASVPEIEHHLATHYPAEWAAYCQRVPWVLIPRVL